MQSEMMARVHAEQRAMIEKQARAAAEDRAKQEAVARVMQEHLARQNAETEIAAKVEAELRAREQAEFSADLRSRQEAQQRAEISATERLQEQENVALGKNVTSRRRSPWGRLVLGALVLIIGGGIAALQVIPLTGLRVRAETLLADRLQEPVSMADLRFVLFPFPQVKIDRITIGRNQQITIANAVLPVPLTALLDDTKDFEEAQLNNVKIVQSILPRFTVFAKARTAETQLNIKSLKINGIKITLSDVDIPLFDATIQTAANGAFENAQITHSKISLNIAPAKEAGALRVTFQGRSIQPAAAPGLEITSFSGSAQVGLEEAAFSNLEMRLAGGTLSGAAELDWSENKFRLRGEFDLNGADIALLLPAFTRDFEASGTLNTKTRFSSQDANLGGLLASTSSSSTFSASKGALNNIDLVRAIQARSKTPQRGGRTAYNEITGEAQSAGGRVSLRNLKLTSGPMNGGGAVEIGTNSDISGRLDVQLGSPTVTVARGALILSGSLKDPQVVSQ